MPLVITFLLDSTEISGTARMTLAAADALIERGHRARIVTRGLPLNWRSSRAEWVFVEEFHQYRPASEELLVAASRETAPAAADLGGARSVLLARRGIGAVADSSFFGEIVDDDFYRDRTPRERDPLRVLLAGAVQVEDHGIGEGYGAIAHARWFHQRLDLVRVSPWAPSREEPLDGVQEFHVALNATEMRRLVHSCDLLLAPSRAAEGLRLVVAEAMAAGLPLLLTATPAHLSLDASSDFAAFAPPENAVAIGEKLIEISADPRERDRLRLRAREVAEQWRPSRVAARFETFASLRR